MDEIEIINQGAIAEQFIGQHFQAMFADKPNRELNCWFRERRSSNAELDFVIALGGKIIPIEVKFGATGTLKSLHQFMGTKQAPFGVRFDTQLPAIYQIDTVINIVKQRKQIKYPLIFLPLYLVERLDTRVMLKSGV